MDGSLDFLGNANSIDLEQVGLSSLLDEYCDEDLNFEAVNMNQGGNELSTINSRDIGHSVATLHGDYSSTDVLSDIATSPTDSSENLSSGRVCSSPADPVSPGTSVGSGNSPGKFSYEKNSGFQRSVDQSKQLPCFLNDLTFDFDDADMEKIANNFMLDGDDVLNSCLFNDDAGAANESAYIQLDDALITADCERGFQDPKKGSGTDIPVSISNSLNVNNTIPKVDVNSTSIVRCTLPNFKPLVLTEEEKMLLEQEKVSIPTDLPLTRSEERVLKRVRRKIRNKKSALESRRRKKDYVGGLENRVAQCTVQNNQLVTKVKDLESQNQSLLMQLKKLQGIVRSFSGIASRTTQASTCVLILLLSFGLFLAPSYGPLSLTQEDANVPNSAGEMHKSRKLLETSAEPLSVEQSSSLKDVKSEMGSVLSDNTGPDMSRSSILQDPSFEIKQQKILPYAEGASSRPGVSQRDIDTYQKSLAASIDGEVTLAKNESKTKNMGDGGNPSPQRDNVEESKNVQTSHPLGQSPGVAVKADMEIPVFQSALTEEYSADASMRKDVPAHISMTDEI